MKKEIYLAGGCFWGMQGYFRELKGVIETTVGYANGDGNECSYKTIKKTSHVEALHIIYDDSVISLNTVLAHFFRVIDPTSIDRQGGDMGHQYRTGIYYVNSDDKAIAREYINNEQRKYSLPIAVELEPLKNYILAEEYHQDYLKKNPNGYCHIDLSLAKKPLE